MEERIKSILWVQEYQEQPGRILIYEKEYEQMLHMEERNRGNLPRAVALRGRNGSGRKFLMGHLAYARRKEWLMCIWMHCMNAARIWGNRRQRF